MSYRGFKETHDKQQLVIQRNEGSEVRQEARARCVAPMCNGSDLGQKLNRWVVRDSYAGMFRLFVCTNISRL